ncbi:hypothetical protein ACXYMO_06090 [Arenibacterium sp. CAU 1754]
MKRYLDGYFEYLMAALVTLFVAGIPAWMMWNGMNPINRHQSPFWTVETAAFVGTLVAVPVFMVSFKFIAGIWPDVVAMAIGAVGFLLLCLALAYYAARSPMTGGQAITLFGILFLTVGFVLLRLIQTYRGTGK